jgi:hypothetical protein
VNKVVVVGWSGIAECIDPALVKATWKIAMVKMLESQEGPT